MSVLLATKEGGAILGPISTLLGWIMDAIFKCTNVFGIMNIGLSIILFTIVIKLLMAPMSVKQQKFSRMNSIMMPEIQAIQAKYKGKKDQESMMKQNMETQAIYEKYGVKPTAGCLQLIIQMPILFALYRVVYNIPAYVGSVKMIYQQIVDQLMNIANYASNSELINLATANRIKEADLAVSDKLIDMMYNFDATEWAKLQELFPSLNIGSQVSSIEKMNSFMGISLFNAPSNYISNHDSIWQLVVALMIPVLAGLSQWISVKITNAQMEQKKKKLGQEDEPSAMESSMKMMTNIMPIMSVVFCFTLASCIGVYWIMSSVVTLVVQILVNNYMDKIDVNDMVKANMEKVNAKRAKRGLPPQKFTQVNQTVKNVQLSEEEMKRKNELRENSVKKNTEYYQTNTNYKPGSLAAKANMVKQYDEKNGKK